MCIEDAYTILNYFVFLKTLKNKYYETMAVHLLGRIRFKKKSDPVKKKDRIRLKKDRIRLKKN